MSGTNYIADKECNPTSVTFANGRRVWINSEGFLDVGWTEKPASLPCGHDQKFWLNFGESEHRPTGIKLPETWACVMCLLLAAAERRDHAKG